MLLQGAQQSRWGPHQFELGAKLNGQRNDGKDVGSMGNSKRKLPNQTEAS